MQAARHCRAEKCAACQLTSISTMTQEETQRLGKTSPFIGLDGKKRRLRGVYMRVSVFPCVYLEFGPKL